MITATQSTNMVDKMKIYRLAPPLSAPHMMIGQFVQPTAEGSYFDTSRLDFNPAPLSQDEISRLDKRFTLEFKPPKQYKDDFISLTPTIWLASERVRDSIESLDPGFHQFVEYELLLKPSWGKAIKKNRYFLFHCTSAIDFIDNDKSEVNKKPIYGGRIFYGLRENQSVVTIKSEFTPSHHIWKSTMLVVSGQYFVTERLKDAWGAMEVGPIEYFECKQQSP